MTPESTNASPTAGPPLPSDRAALLRMAADAERFIKETANADAPGTATIHANKLYELGRIRVRLGEFKKAETLLSQAATAYADLDSPRANKFATNARLRQAAAAAEAGHYSDALGTIEPLVERLDDLDGFEELSGGRAAPLDLWMLMLEAARPEDHQRLYEAAGTALELLDPSNPPSDRGVLVRTLVRRAESAHQLGRVDEAVEMYQRAIACRDDDSAATREYLDRAFPQFASLLTELGRIDEARVAYRCSLDRFERRKGLVARLRVASARLWLWSEK